MLIEKRNIVCCYQYYVFSANVTKVSKWFQLVESVQLYDCFYFYVIVLKTCAHYYENKWCNKGKYTERKMFENFEESEEPLI